MSSLRMIGLVAMCWLGMVFALQADVTLPALFSDHAMIQQGVHVPVWGRAEPGEKVTVALGGQSVFTETGADGKWSVRLEPLAANAQAQELRVTGKNALVVRDVLIGDVWLCAGQSNMEFKMNRCHNATESIPAANVPQIRLFEVKQKTGFTPQDDVVGEWRVCTPATVRLFSAVAYFFGREICDTQKIPVGLIVAAWGGSTGEAWISLDALRAKPELNSVVSHFYQTRDSLDTLRETYVKKTLPDWQKKLDAWQSQYGSEEAKKAAAVPGATPLPQAPRKPPAPDEDQHFPTVLFNGMLSPLIPYGIKGVAWYQGEQNANDEPSVRLYASLLPTLIADWRQRWGQGDFPFLIVQLPGFGPHESWALFREVQRQTLAIPNTALVVTLDLGEEKDVHPRNKIDVGHRLALAARRLVYGETTVPTSPAYRAMSVEGGKARVQFDGVGGGLMIGSAPAVRANQIPDLPLDHLEGFLIAGSDGRFVPAQARIEADNSVLVWSESIVQPVAVRYGWAAFPHANLYNREGLPTAPFTTETISFKR